jgi:hypothetical protein
MMLAFLLLTNLHVVFGTVPPQLRATAGLDATRSYVKLPLRRQQQSIPSLKRQSNIPVYNLDLSSPYVVDSECGFHW